MKDWLWSHAKMLIGIFISTLLIKSGGIIGKIFGTLGLTFIAYQYVMPEVRSFLFGYFAGLPADIYNLVTYVNLDKAMVMILSAGAVKIASGLMLGRAPAAGG